MLPESQAGQKKGSTSAGYCGVSIAVGGSGYPRALTCDKSRKFLYSGGRRLFYKMARSLANSKSRDKNCSLEIINEMFFHFSLPDQILSDQGRQFECGMMEEFCKLLQIEKSQTTPYHPQGDGLVERANRTLLNMLSTVVEEHQEEWESYLWPVRMAYSTSIQHMHHRLFALLFNVW